MAGTPEVKVRIAADDQFTGAAKGITNGVKAIGAAIAGAALGGFFRSATDAAVEYEKSQSKLEATAKLTGVALAELERVSDRGQKEFRLAAPVANDFATELAKLAQKAGDVGKAGPGMAAFLDLGAARGLTASETLKAVQQAVLGIDEGTDKLFGKNPSVLYKEYADQIGTTAGKLTDQEKAQALLTAALNDGLKVQGQYGKFLDTLGGGIALASQRWDEFKLAVGQAMNSAGDTQGALGLVSQSLADMSGWVKENEGLIADLSGSFVTLLQSVGGAVEAIMQFPGIGPTIGLTFKGISTLLVGLGALVQRTGGIIYEFGAKAVGSFATIVQTGGKLLKVFGIEAGETLGRSLTATAEQMKAKSEAMLDASETGFFNGMQRIWDKEVYFARKGLDRKKDEIRETVAVEKDGQDKVTKVHEEGGEKRLTKAQEKAELMKLYMERANDIFAATTKALEESTRPTLRDMKADWSAIDEKVLKAAASIGIAKDAQKELAEAGESVRKKQEAILDAAAKARAEFEDTVDSAASLGLSLVGVATQMGYLDQRAASALTAVINMGASIAKFGIGSPEGLLSVINGLSQLIGGWGSSPAEQARREAHMKNTRALEELSADFGDYTGSASGRTFQGVLGALGGIVGDLDPDKMTVPQRTAFAVRLRAELPGRLREAGLNENDARKLAERYGIDVDKDPLGWYRLFQVLKSRSFGEATSFSDQLSSLEEGFGVLGIDDADDQLSQFGAFLDKNVPALKGVLGDTSTKGGRDAAIAKLKAIYSASVMGKIAPTEYGRSSPTQFRNIVATLLRMLGSADGFLSGAQTVEPTPAPTPTGGGALPGSGASGGTSGLISGGVGPTVGVGGAMFEGFELGGGATIGTQNNTVTLHVQAHPDESAAIYAERVAALVSAQLGQKYNTQRAALGLV